MQNLDNWFKKQFSKFFEMDECIDTKSWLSTNLINHHCKCNMIQMIFPQCRSFMNFLGTLWIANIDKAYLSAFYRKGHNLHWPIRYNNTIFSQFQNGDFNFSIDLFVAIINFFPLFFKRNNKKGFLKYQKKNLYTLIPPIQWTFFPRIG